jgi:hypothetical protein
MKVVLICATLFIFFSMLMNSARKRGKLGEPDPGHDADADADAGPGCSVGPRALYRQRHLLQ